MRSIYIANINDNKTSVYSALMSLVVHILIALLLSFLIVLKPKDPILIELDWGASSGAPNQTIAEAEDVRKSQEQAQPQGGTAQSKVDLPETKSSSEETVPSTKKTTSKTTVGKKKESRTGEETKTISRKRVRPGGAGISTGYSIEWSGVGSRKLLSGRVPQYPEGTDKEMPVILQFSVLPDGSVSSIIPLKKSDELLEREAISALRTWRFDPLSAQFEQKSQTGVITFIFKLEK
ncbi:MAG: energy transducer TonB [Bacteroidota bacterium]